MASLDVGVQIMKLGKGDTTQDAGEQLIFDGFGLTVFLFFVES